MSDLHIVVLAAGKGTRMKSATPKVLHRVGGLPILDHVLRAAASLEPTTTTVVVGYKPVDVQAAFSHRTDLSFVVQEPQLGTAHALLTAESALRGTEGTLVLLSGDVPLLSAQTLKTLVDHHVSSHATATVLTASIDNPHGYGRIIRVGEQIARIVEERDADQAQREIREVNGGVYAFAMDGLFDAVRRIATENAQKEYYLPDLVAMFRARQLRVETVTVKNPDEIRGINSRAELASVSRLMREQTNQRLMDEGVTLEDPATAYIGREVAIGPDTVIHPCVTIEGQTTIGSGCRIHSGVRITDSQLGNGVTIQDHTVMVLATIADDAIVGPFARLRPHVTIGERVYVGNFVEMKKTVIGDGSKAGHLSYLGDAIIGRNVNIGAGTITCNYDGSRKHVTTIENGAFIGSDTQLVAPVTVGAGAYVGTGSTVREDVPPGALAVSAGKQRNIEDWVKKKRDGS